MSSFKLQKYIRNLSELNLVLYSDEDNFQLNERWVTDIDRDYYAKFTTGIKEILEEEFSEANNDVLLNDVRNALGEAKRKALKKWEDISTGSSEVHFIGKSFSSSIPTYSTLDFLVNEEQEERKKIIFDGVADLLKLDTEKFPAGGDLHSYLTSPEASSPSMNIKFEYAFGHLFYVLLIKVELIDDLLNDLEEFVNPDDLSFMENANNNPYSIEFNLTKTDIALFFNILYEEGLIKTEGKNEKGRKTHLKKYIDNANIFYHHDKKRTKVNEIKKEFTKIGQAQYYKVEKNEKLLLEDLINKLQNRLNELKDRMEKK